MLSTTQKILFIAILGGSISYGIYHALMSIAHALATLPGVN